MPRLLGRVLSAWWFYFAVMALMMGLLVPAIKSWGVPKEGATWVALLFIPLLAPYHKLWNSRRTEDYKQVREFFPFISAVWALVSVVVILAVSSFSLGLAGTAAVALAVAVVVWWLSRTLQRRALRRRVLRAQTVADADELGGICMDILDSEDEQLDDPTRACLWLSVSGALITIANDPEQDDDLALASDIIDDTFENGPHGFRFKAALLGLEAKDVKLERTGDHEGYDYAVQRMMDAAFEEARHDPTAIARGFAARGMSYARRGRAAEARDDASMADFFRDLAATDLRRAIECAPLYSDERAVYTLQLALVEGPQPLHDTLDESIKYCRRALRRLWLVRSDERVPGFLALAQRLELRGDLERRPHDLLLALRLYAKVTSERQFGKEARKRIARLESLDMQRSGFSRLVARLGLMQVAVLARETITPSAPDRVAVRLARWAADRDDAAQAADAWSRWIGLVSDDLRRRVTDDKVSRLPDLQHQVATAAYWMVRANRPGDAAVALEVGRAVLLTERMDRARVGLIERLTRAGHHELADEWRAVGERLRDVDRARFSQEDVDSTPHGSSEYHAIAERNSLLRSIARIEGFDDVNRAPSLADVRAAACEGPLVYLATIDQGGFAVIVRNDVAQPTAVDLPLLKRHTVLEYVDQLRAASTEEETAEINWGLLPQLWSWAIEPLLPHLPRQALVTLIPTGPLGELPLHAAGCAPTASGVWTDRTGGIVFRYAPNARVLTRSQQTVRGLGTASLRLLTAAVPDKPGLNPLPHAEVESNRVAETFGPDAERAMPATVENVLRHLDDCAVWHFACHGKHVADRPLESSLELADGELSLGAMFAREASTRRLAVLSACQSARVDAVVPDEVVGFPGALLQSGVAGVISCQGNVNDAAAMLLVSRFFEGFRNTPEVHPARALADAQKWLRSCTNAELAAAFPTLHSPPDHADEDWDEQFPYSAPGTWALFNYTGT